MQLAKIALKVTNGRFQTDLTRGVNRGESRSYVLSADPRVRRYGQVQVPVQQREEEIVSDRK